MKFYFDCQKIIALKRLLLLFVLIVLVKMAMAKTYYFSSSMGNDAHTVVQAQNSATPWKTIQQLNAFFKNLIGGDKVYFKRGDVFNGQIIVTQSGSTGNPILIGAYGSGNLPTISGWRLLKDWQPIDNGIFATKMDGISNAVNVVTINNQPQPLGRYPNADAGNGGYLTYEYFSAPNSIIDQQLPPSPNWTGAELVIKKNRYTIERSLIIQHQGNTVFYQAPSNITPTVGFGYFIQKHRNTLDQFGEWWYNAKTKSIEMYFGKKDAAAFLVKVSTVDVLLNTGQYSYLNIEQLHFESANVYAVQIGDLKNRATNISLSHCSFNNSGRNAVYATNVSYATIEYCAINNSFNNAIQIENEGGISSFGTIRYNDIKNTGTMAGMGYWGDTHTAIAAFCSNALIEYNTIENTGYNGIAFYYDNTIVRNNFIRHFSFVKDDGAGIYTWVGDGNKKYKGRAVTNNIILNGTGEPDGTNSDDKLAHGIYIDDGSSGVTISGNSVAAVANSGLYIHNAFDLMITNNSFFNNGEQQALFVHDQHAPNAPIKNVTFSGNQLVSQHPNQRCILLKSDKEEIGFVGTMDNNWFIRHLDNNAIISERSPKLFNPNGFTNWQRQLAKDINTLTLSGDSTNHQRTTPIRFEYNASNAVKAIQLNRHYVGIDGRTFEKKISLAPFTSIILLPKKMETTKQN